MKVVVGLGNPGSKYQNTRHNVGFEVVGELAKRFVADGPKVQFESEVCEIRIDGTKILLVAPQTFMNLSGRAVGKLCDFYKLEPAAFAVVCDDLNLPTGRLRWRAKGSAGGQKGLLDITRHLGTQDIARLRIGIGRPPGRQNPADFVLGKFNKSEREEMDISVAEAADSVELWVREGVVSAMNRFNQKPEPKKKSKPKADTADDSSPSGK
ncbi:MAG: aminoacyl-tRNA hydrolase [Planctomycetaceae bacterium]